MEEEKSPQPGENRDPRYPGEEVRSQKDGLWGALWEGTRIPSLENVLIPKLGMRIVVTRHAQTTWSWTTGISEVKRAEKGWRGLPCCFSAITLLLCGSRRSRENPKNA